MYKYVRDIWKKPKESLGEIWKARLIQWRRDPSTLRIKRPTRIDRARSLGYKAKKGYIMVRQRVLRGGHKRYDVGKRRPKTSRMRMVLEKNYKQIAEERANKSFKNCEILNSYWVGQDGKYIWHEIILVDKDSPSILADKKINWIAKHKGRTYRGLTSAGKKTRGLRNKGKGAEKLRPSKKASYNRKVNQRS
tara:strand:+ start:5861 stop:6436 length:576 start_codon:yes stop_codon:yes gene_type:complete